MPNFICVTCGAQFSDSDHPPDQCAICSDDRQFVALNGQHWTTHGELARSHANVIREEEPGLNGIGIEPRFAIGQRALLIRQRSGNVLWDCIPLLDDAAVDKIQGQGGLSAIAISHPHYYTGMIEWAHTFDCPVYLHADDRLWIMRPDPSIEFWEGETKSLGDHLTLIRCGGHFAGGTVLHWPGGADGEGALLSGDIIQVVEDRRWVSFMYSYPNLIPLRAATVQRIVKAVEPFSFDRIYGAWWTKVVRQDARRVVERSARRYIDAIAGR